MTAVFVMPYYFLIVSVIYHYTDLSLSPSQYATYIEFFFVSHVELTSNDLSLLHCSVRPLFKNEDKLQKIIIHVQNHTIALSETKLQANLKYSPLHGYHFIGENSQMQAFGLGAYVKNNLNHLQKYDLQYKTC